MIIVLTGILGWAVALVLGILLWRLRVGTVRSLRAHTAGLRDAVLSEYRTVQQAVTAAAQMQPHVLPWRRQGELQQQMEVLLAQNPDFFGVWAAFEPGAGQTDHTSVYVYRSAQGAAVMSIPDVEREEFYRQPLETRQAILLDPFEYSLDGTPVLMTTAAVPVFDGAAAVGVCGVDVRLRRSRELDRELLALPADQPSGHHTAADRLLQQAVRTAGEDARTMRDILQELAGLEDRILSRMSVTRTGTRYIEDAIADMRRAVAAQSREAEDSGAVIEQISRSIGSLGNLIQDQSAMVEEASAAVEQMVANIKSLRSTLDANAERFSVLDQHSRTGSERMAEVDTLVQQIAAASVGLGEANTVLQGIAAQTNLLAMNAAIEAAHAGSAGRGFSVVAEEIRKLAENAAGQSTTISKNLKDVADRITSCVQASSASREAMQNLTGIIAEVNDREREINLAMQEQANGSEQVTTALHRMVELTSEVASASAEMDQGRERMVASVQTISSEAAGLLERVEGIGEQGQDLRDAVDAVAEATDEMTRVLYRGGVSTVSQAVQPYIFELDQPAGIMREIIRGSWKPEDARSYIADFQTAVQPALGSPWGLLTDMQEWDTASAEVEEIVHDSFTWNRSHGMVANANVAGSRLKRLQLQRIFADAGVQDICAAFSTPAEAETWLKQQLEQR
ncbi:methyl-accepting chemotaxis protein [Spirochaeta africana]|uniref:Methyl-accepting chemotaxis protein n=1 Tax=Spirochaeta africana (strain ATCC 700263 / DSM 8902 / Z-7692) TaxID=889378 RepID=H9ULC0_SPIAZ|nr:methyl-accepting chemotaxis protein [Spirochaeta africana]AFG38313.1 methyl-accepting chemotaxis protein [Spirochaeta africana DSM 8902]